MSRKKRRYMTSINEGDWNRICNNHEKYIKKDYDERKRRQLIHELHQLVQDTLTEQCRRCDCNSLRSYGGVFCMLPRCIHKVSSESQKPRLSGKS